MQLAVETGRYGNKRVARAQRLCQRFDAYSVDDVEHMIFNCVAMNAEWQKQQSLIACGRVAIFSRLFHPGHNRIGCFCARLLQGLHRVIIESALFIYGCLVCRAVVGHLNRPEMAVNKQIM